MRRVWFSEDARSVPYALMSLQKIQGVQRCLKGWSVAWLQGQPTNPSAAVAPALRLICTRGAAATSRSFPPDARTWTQTVHIFLSQSPRSTRACGSDLSAPCAPAAAAPRVPEAAVIARPDHRALEGGRRLCKGGQKCDLAYGLEHSFA